MIGLIKITPVQGSAVLVNPNHITFFGKNSPELTASVSNQVQYIKGTTGMLIGSMFFQVLETENQIVNALTRLRRKQEQNLVDLKKEIDKDEWQGDTDQEDF